MSHGFLLNILVTAMTVPTNAFGKAVQSQHFLVRLPLSNSEFSRSGDETFRTTALLNLPQLGDRKAIRPERSLH